jgi:hypothetical protein
MRAAAKQYLWAWFWWTFAVLANVLIFNLVVDPYGLFPIVEVGGLNRIKSQASERAPLFKRTAVQRAQPTAVILGNSRAEIGFDPESPAWPSSARPVFNLALPGAGISAVAAEFGQALKSTAPRLVFVGLDFVDFRIDPASRETFTLPAARGDGLAPVRERIAALLTMNALADSLATIKAQHDPYPTSLTAAGFNPKRDYVGIARREGYYALFRQRDQENATAYMRGPKAVFESGGKPAPGFDAVDSIIALAQMRDITLRFVIYPYHAHTLTLFHLTGLWPAYEDWKRELTRRVDAARGTMDVELWDFTGFSPYADERVPRPGDTHTELQWYWEAGHFKKALGDLLLADMFNVPVDGEHWGSRLTQSNIEEQLLRQRSTRDKYESSHPEDRRELAMLVNALSPLR